MTQWGKRSIARIHANKTTWQVPGKLEILSQKNKMCCAKGETAEVVFWPNAHVQMCTCMHTSTHMYLCTKEKCTRICAHSHKYNYINNKEILLYLNGKLILKTYMKKLWKPKDLLEFFPALICMCFLRNCLWLTFCTIWFSYRKFPKGQFSLRDDPHSVSWASSGSADCMQSKYFLHCPWKSPEGWNVSSPNVGYY